MLKATILASALAASLAVPARANDIQRSSEVSKSHPALPAEVVEVQSPRRSAGSVIIGDAVGENSDDVMADLGTLQLFDLAKGKEVMGTAASPGKIYDNVKAAADFWKTQGKVDTTVNPSDAVDPSFINSL